MTGQRPLPRDTMAVVRSNGLDHCCNLGLLLDRFAPWEYWNNRGTTQWDLSFEVDDRKQGQVIKRGGEAKGLWLSDRRDDRQTRLIDEPLLRAQRMDIELLKAHHERWQATVAAYGATREAGLCFDLQTESRLVVGLGSESVLETTMTLQRVYGFPVIPGSALKGLARTWALLALAEALGVPALDYEAFQALVGRDGKKGQPTSLNRLESLLTGELESEDEEKRRGLGKDLEKLQSEEAVKRAAGKILGMDLATFCADEGVVRFRAVFGYLGRARAVIFFDGVPANIPTLGADVMNVHYPDYYRDEGGGTPPSDDQQPNPVSFLTVEAGSAFSFAVGPRQRADATHVASAGLARGWLEAALRQAGVGAKTGSGYGFFEDRQRQPVSILQADREPSVPRMSPDEPPQRQQIRRNPPPSAENDEVSEKAQDFMRQLQARKS